MFMGFGSLLAAAVLCGILVLSFAFRQRWAPLVLLFGAANFLWLVISFHFDLTGIYSMVSSYLFIALALVCTPAGLAGVLLRLLLNRQRRRREKAVGGAGRSRLDP
jgi:hypothetical protein